MAANQRLQGSGCKGPDCRLQSEVNSVHLQHRKQYDSSRQHGSKMTSKQQFRLAHTAKVC